MATVETGSSNVNAGALDGACGRLSTVCQAERYRMRRLALARKLSAARVIAEFRGMDLRSTGYQDNNIPTSLAGEREGSGGFHSSHHSRREVPCVLGLPSRRLGRGRFPGRGGFALSARRQFLQSRLEVLLKNRIYRPLQSAKHLPCLF